MQLLCRNLAGGYILDRKMMIIIYNNTCIIEYRYETFFKILTKRYMCNISFHFDKILFILILITWVSLFTLQKTDSSILAQFFFADEELNEVAAELDSFDGRKDPERCTALVNKLRACQDKVLGVVQKIIDEAIGNQKANRDFRVKFPDDVLQENLAGQLWFGAEVNFFLKEIKYQYCYSFVGCLHLSM